MLRAILGARVVLAMAVAACIGVWGLHTYPVQRDDPFLALIQLERPLMYDVLTYGYATVWFTTPFLAASLLTSVLTIVAYRYPYATRARALTGIRSGRAMARAYCSSRISTAATASTRCHSPVGLRSA